MRRMVLVLAAGALVGTLGCGKKAEEKAVERAIERQTGGKADVDFGKQRVSITTEEGKTTVQAGEGLALPETFPKDVVVPGNATLMATVDTPQGMSVTFRSRDELGEVIASYKKGMAAKGWKQEMAMDMGDGSTLLYRKGERAAQVVVGRDKSEGGSTITVVAAAE